jgi:lysophospholipase L1-like esterase
MVLGESTAVGVGAAEHSRALPGFLALALRENLQRTVTWSVHGRHGATARRLIDSVIPELDDPAPDVVVVTIGINDLARRRSFDQWRADLSELIGVVRSTYERTMILVAGMPPVHTFPSLPQPLRYVLGARAKVMDRIMREVVSAHGATYVATDESFARDSRVFASDGLHPSSEGYRLWATELARAGCLVASETSDQ